MTDSGGSTELCDVMDEEDSHYRIQFTPQMKGIHILSIKHKALHISGKLLCFLIFTKHDNVNYNRSKSLPSKKRSRSAIDSVYFPFLCVFETSFCVLVPRLPEGQQLLKSFVILLVEPMNSLRIIVHW